MEFLKESLGEELYGQVAEKLKDSKIKLADISGGAYVGKDKFSALETEKNGLTEQLKEANKQIEAFKGMDIDGVKAAAADWEAKYNKAQEESAAKIADMEYSAALKDALSGEKFSSVYARDGVIAEIRGRKLPLQGGKIMGLDDAIKAVREAQPDAFAQQQQQSPPKLRGAGMGPGGKPPESLTEKEAALAAAQKAMNIKT